MSELRMEKREGRKQGDREVGREGAMRGKTSPTGPERVS